MHPKIIFMDLEGTLLRKEYRLDNGKVAPSAWTLLAERLGSECLAEEELTKDKWNRKEYAGYVEWMRDTIQIHRKYGLHREVFDEVVNSVEFMPGVQAAAAVFQEWGSITAIVTGGFKALADRVQRQFRFDHALSACEYFFEEQTGTIEHFNLLPSDEAGKVDFVSLIAKEHGVNLEDCVFVGDGKNDVCLASAVGCSIAFNAQPELKKVATYAIDQQIGNEDFAVVATIISQHFQNLR